MAQKNTVIGIDLGATNVRVGKVRDGNIEKLEAERIKKEDDPKILLKQIETLIDKVIDPEVESIGIGVPSVVDVEKGIVYDAINIPSWKEVHLKTIFEKRFEKPVFVNNDANCFALGEMVFGKGAGYQSVVGLILGTGFAAGLVLNGKLYNGKNCGAGEMGMIPYRDSIYEHYCSAQFFQRTLQLDGKELFDRAKDKDPEALRIFEEFGTHVGNGIKTVLYSFDPEIIVFGGSVRHAYPFFKESMWKSMQDFGFPHNLESLHIEISEIDNIAILGAAAIALEALGTG